jgi:hypothetical protein
MEQLFNHQDLVIIPGKCDLKYSFFWESFSIGAALGRKYDRMGVN